MVLAVQLHFYLFRSEQTIGSGDNDNDGKRCGVVYIDLTEKVNEGNISDEKEEEKEEMQSMTVYYNQRYLLFIKDYRQTKLLGVSWNKSEKQLILKFFVCYGHNLSF